MPETAQKPEIHQEYWKPPSEHAGPISAPHTICCTVCGTDFLLGSRYCHVCGEPRDTRTATSGWLRRLDFVRIKDALGLSAASLVAFIFGMVFLIAALATGLIYSANTVLDWQAVQLWRVEWLMAAIATFTAGILLKRN